MRNLKVILFTVSFICLTTKIYSQGDFSIHLGPSLPLFDFGSGDLNDMDAGFAAVGHYLFK